nr:hypothetical protein [uncultured Capnocytophaga sp.]
MTQIKISLASYIAFVHHHSSLCDSLGSGIVRALVDFEIYS